MDKPRRGNKPKLYDADTVRRRKRKEEENPGVVGAPTFFWIFIFCSFLGFYVFSVDGG